VWGLLLLSDGEELPACAMDCCRTTDPPSSLEKGGDGENSMKEDENEE
jgi:hypothetical protein